MTIAQYLGNLLQTGLGSLAAYLAAHVLLCLLPAFLIAGALAALVPKEAITKYLGRTTPRWISYPAAAVGGFVLAVCSCTVMPLFASIHKKGAGLGPAITFLFVGPAVNILAISLTGVAIGMDIALARVVLSVGFGVVIGLVMAWGFRKSDAAHDTATNHHDVFAQGATVPPRTWVFFALLVGILIAGTLQVDVLTQDYATFELASGATLATGGAAVYQVQVWLDSIVPPNPDLGIEGITVHGLLLIGLLICLGVTAWRGLEHVDEGFNRWTFAALGLLSLTLLVAAFSVTAIPTGLRIGVPGKLLAMLALVGAVWWTGIKSFEVYEMQEWLWEMWRFVKQIMPLLLVGVFVAGAARVLIPAVWITTLAGENTLWANMAGVFFGVFMYFPTLVEVPIAQTFLSLGMQRGPLLAYLLSDPGLSFQSILITRKIVGDQKTAAYVGLVAVFSTLSGLIFGWFFG